MMTPKLLVSSMDVWNDISGSDTFTNLLSGYDPACVANIYLRSGIPNSNSANNYFYICENSVIKSILNKQIITGKKVEKNIKKDDEIDICQIQNVENKRYTFFSKHRWWIAIYLRELLWKIGHWNSHELNKYIEVFSPEVLLFPIESYIHFNRLNLFLIQKTHVPAIAMIWDDNFTYKGSNNLGFKIHRFFVRKSIKKIIPHVSKLYVINEQIQREIKEEFGVSSEILTKGVSISNIKEKIEFKKPYTMIYTGKLIYGRFETTVMVVNALKIINRENIKIKFNIYSGTQLSSRDLKKLECPGVHFCGRVSQAEVTEIQHNADILLMVEALKGKHKYDARLSFSTKLVDYLSAGKCIIAVGPRNIAPIEYLMKNNVSYIASNKDEIYDVFQRLNKDEMSQYGFNAQKLAKTNHSIAEIQERLYRTIEELAKGR